MYATTVSVLAFFVTLMVVSPQYDRCDLGGCPSLTAPDRNNTVHDAVVMQLVCIHSHFVEIDKQECTIRYNIGRFTEHFISSAVALIAFIVGLLLISVFLELYRFIHRQYVKYQRVRISETTMPDLPIQEFTLSYFFVLCACKRASCL